MRKSFIPNVGAVSPFDEYLAKHRPPRLKTSRELRREAARKPGAVTPEAAQANRETEH